MDFQRSLTRLKNPREDTDSIQLLGIDYSRGDSTSSPPVDLANKVPQRCASSPPIPHSASGLGESWALCHCWLSPFHLLVWSLVFPFSTEEYFAFLLRYLGGVIGWSQQGKFVNYTEKSDRSALDWEKTYYLCGANWIRIPRFLRLRITLTIRKWQRQNWSTRLRRRLV